MTFEICLVGPGRVAVPPPLLSGADLAGVRAVTRSAWYVLSGRHRTSQVVLTVRPESLARWQEAARVAVSRGDRMALVLDGTMIGEMILQRAPLDRELAIDAGFFSTGTERDKAQDARRLATQINAGLR